MTDEPGGAEFEDVFGVDPKDAKPKKVKPSTAEQQAEVSARLRRASKKEKRPPQDFTEKVMEKIEKES